jgi:hypothetical protein
MMSPLIFYQKANSLREDQYIIQKAQHENSNWNFPLGLFVPTVLTFQPCAAWT